MEEGRRLAAEGYTHEAAAKFKEASALQNGISTRSMHHAEQKSKEFNTANKNLDILTRRTAAITDKQTYETARMVSIARGGSLEPWLMDPVYSKQVQDRIDYIRDSTKGGADQAGAKAKLIREQAAAAASAASAAHTTEQTKLMRQRQAQHEDAQRDIVKVGGKRQSFDAWETGEKRESGDVSKGSQNIQARGEQMIGAVADLGRSQKMINALPITVTSGLFGGMRSKTGFFDAPLNVGANAMTSEVTRMYNIASSNIGQALAIIESGGYKPNQTQINSYQEKLRWLPTDTIGTKLFSMADAKAQAVARSDVVLSNPAIPKEQKDLLRSLIKKMEDVVPFEPEDVIEARSRGVSINKYIEDFTTRGSDGKIHTRHSSMTDADWAAYRKDQGGKR